MFRQVATVLVVATNTPLIHFSLQQQARTFLDQLVVVDCCLCIANMATVNIIHLTIQNTDVPVCLLMFLPHLLVLCNRQTCKKCLTMFYSDKEKRSPYYQVHTA